MQPNSPTDAEIEAIAKNVARVLWSETYSGTASTVILAALKDVERRTAERCAEIVAAAQVNSTAGFACRDNGPATLRDAATDIRKEFHLD